MREEEKVALGLLALALVSQAWRPEARVVERVVEVTPPKVEAPLAPVEVKEKEPTRVVLAFYPDATLEDAYRCVWAFNGITGREIASFPASPEGLTQCEEERARIIENIKKAIEEVPPPPPPPPPTPAPEAPPVAPPPPPPPKPKEIVGECPPNTVKVLNHPFADCVCLDEFGHVVTLCYLWREIRTTPYGDCVITCNYNGTLSLTSKEITYMVDVCRYAVSREEQVALFEKCVETARSVGNI
jgi:U5 snRNP spliceosome subunit